MTILRCIDCGAEYPPSQVIYVCRKCKGLLEVLYDMDGVRTAMERSDWRRRPFNVWRYRDLLPIDDESKIVTLDEGGTPLYRCQRLGEILGLDNLYVKFEGMNPSGSFKDRGMTASVSKAMELGMKAVICASTGNTSSSMAAYASKAGLRGIVLVPHGKVAMGKLAQARAYGAKVILVRGSFDDAFSMVVRIALESKLYLLNSLNPFRLEGQKTAAFEVVEQLERAPDKLVIPVGNAGNISAYWKGFREWKELGLSNSLPNMIGVQAAGSSPIARAIKEGKEEVTFVDKPETVATAIRIGHPVSWKKAVRAIRESGGTAEIVSDEEILSAQRLLASKEGIFAEPASAASVAGLRKLAESGLVERGETVVCVATGCGLKDINVISSAEKEMIVVEPNLAAIRKALVFGW